MGDFYVSGNLLSGCQEDYRKVKERIYVVQMSIVESQDYFERHQEIILHNFRSEIVKDMLEIRYWRIFDTTPKSNPNLNLPIIISHSLIYVLVFYITNTERLKEINSPEGAKLNITETAKHYYKLLFVIPSVISRNKVLYDACEIEKDKINHGYNSNKRATKQISTNDNKQAVTTETNDEYDPVGSKSSASEAGLPDLKYKFAELNDGLIFLEVQKLECDLTSRLGPFDFRSLRILLVFLQSLLQPVFQGEQLSISVSQPKHQSTMRYFKYNIEPVLKLLNYLNQSPTEREFMTNNAHNVHVKPSEYQLVAEFEKKVDVSGRDKADIVVTTSDHEETLVCIKSIRPSLFKGDITDTLSLSKWVDDSPEFQDIVGQTSVYSSKLKAGFAAIEDGEHTFFFKAKRDQTNSPGNTMIIEALATKDVLLKGEESKELSTNSMNLLENRLIYAIIIFKKSLGLLRDPGCWRIIEEARLKVSDTQKHGDSTSLSQIEPSHDYESIDTSSGKTIDESSTLKIAEISKTPHNVDSATQTQPSPVNETKARPLVQTVLMGYSAGRGTGLPVIELSNLNGFQLLTKPDFSKVYLISHETFNRILNTDNVQENTNIAELMKMKLDTSGKIVLKCYINEPMMEKLLQDKDWHYNFNEAKMTVIHHFNKQVRNEIEANEIIGRYNMKNCNIDDEEKKIHAPPLISYGLITQGGNVEFPVGLFIAFEYMSNLVPLENEEDMNGVVSAVKKLHNIQLSHGDLHLKNAYRIDNTKKILLLDFERAENFHKADQEWHIKSARDHDFYKISRMRFTLGLPRKKFEDYQS